MRRHRAFTLIELLTVMAIIAILTSILLPVLSRAKEKGRTAVCQSNLKEIGMAFHMYVEDWDGLYPWHCDWAHFGGDRGTRWWMNQLQPYIKNWQIFVCPSHGTEHFGRGGLVRCGGYGMNISPQYGWPWGHTFCGASETEIERPAELILVGDSGPEDWPRLWLAWPPGAYGSTPTCNLSDRHNGGANILFADGHVKWFNVQFLVSHGNLWRNP